jgi:cytochrome c553
MKNVGFWAVLGTVGLVFIGGMVSYVWVAQLERSPGQTFFGAWCSALGVPGNWATAEQTVSADPASEVVLSHTLLNPEPDDVGHGATLALRCTMCHGPTGISFANAPNLAGQYAVVVYKQLRDYQSGIRTHSIMTAMAHTLSDLEMRQIAAYYASLPHPTQSTVLALEAAPDIVKWGAPMRNIAPCGACHGAIDHSMAGPWLQGEPAAYIREQLTAFARGARRNDINGQMRAMARDLSSQEIEQAATYYAGGKP